MIDLPHALSELQASERGRCCSRGFRRADEPVVGNSEVKKLEDRVRELERMLGRKTMEV